MVDIYPKVEVLGAGARGYLKMLLQNLYYVGYCMVPYATGSNGSNYYQYESSGTFDKYFYFKFYTLSTIKGKILPFPPYAKFRFDRESSEVYMKEITVKLQKYEEGTWKTISEVTYEGSFFTTHCIVALPSLLDDYEINNQLRLYCIFKVAWSEATYPRWWRFYFTANSDDSYFMLPFQP